MNPEYKELNERISLYEQKVKDLEKEVDRVAVSLDTAELGLYVTQETLAELKRHREKMLEERVYLYTNSPGIRLMESGANFTAWTKKYGWREPVVPISVPKVQLGKSWDSTTGDYGTVYVVPAGSDVRIEEESAKEEEERLYLYTCSTGARYVREGEDLYAWEKNYSYSDKKAHRISVPKSQAELVSERENIGKEYYIPEGSDVRFEEEPSEDRVYLWSNQSCIDFYECGSVFLPVWDSRHYYPGEILVSIPQSQVEEDEEGWFTVPAGADVRVEGRDVVLAYASDFALQFNKVGAGCYVWAKDGRYVSRSMVAFDRPAISWSDPTGYALDRGAKLYVLPKVDDEEED